MRTGRSRRQQGQKKKEERETKEGGRSNKLEERKHRRKPIATSATLGRTLGAKLSMASAYPGASRWPPFSVFAALDCARRNACDGGRQGSPGPHDNGISSLFHLPADQGVPSLFFAFSSPRWFLDSTDGKQAAVFSIFSFVFFCFPHSSCNKRLFYSSLRPLFYYYLPSQ